MTIAETIMPRAFIPAFTGAQSTAIAGALRESGWSVDGSSRRDAGDARERAKGADVLVLTVPQDHRPGAMIGFVEDWVAAAQGGGIGRIVLNVGATPGPADTHPFFAELHAMENRVAASGLRFTILRPTVYLDNLAAPWAAAGVANGTIAYPATPEAEVSWMSHRTLGAWVAAVVDGGADGRTIPVGGPEALTGDALAREIGAALDRDMAYVPIPPESFAEGMNAAMGAPAGDRIASLYAWLADEPTLMKVDPAEARDLGVPLESAREFATRVLS